MIKKYPEELFVLLGYGIVIYIMHMRYNIIGMLETDWYYTVSMCATYCIMVMVAITAFIFNSIPLVNKKLDPELNNVLYRYYVIVFCAIQVIEAMIIIKVIYTQEVLNGKI